MKELPDKPSELIRLALEDLRKAEADPRYTVNMNVWHEEQLDGEARRTCSVCLAGAVMAGTLEKSPFDVLEPENCGRHQSKLKALNQFRMGELHAGLSLIPIVWEREGIPKRVKITGYHPLFKAFDNVTEEEGLHYREKFHEEMGKLADRFEEAGL